MGLQFSFKNFLLMIKELVKEKGRRKFTFELVSKDNYHVSIWWGTAYYNLKVVVVGTKIKIMGIDELHFTKRDTDVDIINIVRDFAKANYPDYEVYIVKQDHIAIFKEFGYDDLVKAKIGVGKGYLIPEQHMSNKY